MLSRLSICERASIDECYLDISAEAGRRLAAAAGNPAPTPDAERIHVAGQASRAQLFLRQVQFWLARGARSCCDGCFEGWGVV